MNAAFMQEARVPEAGLLVVDKPSGWTSHDVVGRVRRLAGTRRVGHAGTLDPMATGVLILGIERATKLLGYLALHDKAYDATIRLGATTVTDDAEGDVLESVDASAVSDDAIRAGIASLTGDILQAPSAVSAIKVDGKRSYARVRAGEAVELPPRAVTLSAFDLLEVRRDAGFVDLDVRIECTTGTYVRALARDLGSGLGVGGHLTALRRTRVGSFTLDEARTLEQLEEGWQTIPLEQAVDRCFPRLELDADEARAVSHGGKLPLTGEPAGVLGAFAPTGEVVALMRAEDGRLRSVVVLAPGLRD
jgi:tRNA pseudouridine55 synthase